MIKQLFASNRLHTYNMFNYSLNDVLADNLARLMKAAGHKQESLAKISGVAQTTISLYLSPSRRQPSKSGKPPSAKFSEVEALAKALSVEPWSLLRPHPIESDSAPWPFKLVSRAEFELLSPAQQFAIEQNFANIVRAFSDKAENYKSPITEETENLSEGKPYIHKTGIIEDDIDSINQNRSDIGTGTNDRRKPGPHK